MRPRASDPVFVEVAWSRLISVVEQEAQALLRTAFTNIVRESGDLSAGVFDLEGRMVAQAVTGTPVTSTRWPWRGARAARAGPGRSPGDVLPPTTRGGLGHLNDITVVTPVFHRGASSATPKHARHGHRRPRHHRTPRLP
jgi:N-methylhydantoinase B/oxoprolinase/acetone carboxylase alpha subunit